MRHLLADQSTARRGLIATAAMMVVLAVIGASAAADGPALWVYAPVNFQVEKSTDDLIALLKRAKAAGYSAAVVTDYKFGKLTDRPEHYYRNLERTRAAAADLGIELIPCVAPIGYSNSILVNNPNLAEGIPVKDCPLIVRGGQTVAANDVNLLAGGGFDAAEKQRPAGWDWADGFTTTTVLDDAEKHGGKSSLRMTDFTSSNKSGNGRVSKKITLRPWTEYRATVWIKTRGLAGSGALKIAVLPQDSPTAEGRSLNFQNLGVKATQDWTRHTVVFNSLEFSAASFYIGIWGGGAGTFWLDDVELREAPGLNMVRRDGCPLRVTDATGKVEYVEGKDFEKWSDPRMGTDPYTGEYATNHAPPALMVTQNSRIRSGDKLLVSYYHAAIVYDGQVTCCLGSDELFEYIRAQTQLIEKYLKPRRYFMQHDEIRTAGWCDLCHKEGVTAGKLLADNGKRCAAIIHEVNPKAEVMVWSDMFDPNHNAVDKYYLVSSTLAGSWEGLDKSVTLVNWNGGNAGKSLRFFADRGHAQVIAGYYDNRDVVGNVKRWKSAAQGVPVEAYMYTTWRNDYRDLESWSQAMR